MIVRVSLYMLVGLCLVSGPLMSESSWAQEFNYQVPKAPEFDSRGNLVGPDPSYAARADGYNTAQQVGRPRQSARSGGLEPRVRSASAPVGMAVNAQPRTMNPPQSQGAPAAAGNMRPNAQQPQGRPDCSVYPMMIAKAQNDAQMQGIAKEFLTCLLMNGWDQEKARQQVITTIQAYEMAQR